MGLFKKSQEEILEGRIRKLMGNQPYKKEIESDPDKFVVAVMEQDISVALIVDKHATTPDEFAKAGKMLSEKFSEEVSNKVMELYVDFCEKYGVTPFTGYYSKLSMEKMMGGILDGKG